ncbi:MAG: hypothetical protein Ct9H90mP16_21080 [Candidatus Poseidoniales archaeon]|nr:MAG: hypothetical protein Ct9H90mP16_21080 [Candidatus Poseidoniales archaeon]
MPHPACEPVQPLLRPVKADSNKFATVRANVTASMVSNAAVGVATSDIPSDGWWISPGESITVPFTIWNNASQQDAFTFSFDETGVFGWDIELLSSPNVIVGPEHSTRVFVEFTAPDTAQANDPGPIVTPHIISTESGMNGDELPFSGIRVRQLHDISLTMNTPEMDVIPASKPNPLPSRELGEWCGKCCVQFGSIFRLELVG